MSRPEPIEKALAAGAEDSAEEPVEGRVDSLGDLRLNDPSPTTVSSRNNGGAPALSHAQQRVWFLDQLEQGRTAFTLSGVVQLHGNLLVAGLAEALRSLERRHTILRTSFPSVDGQPRQIVESSSKRRWSVVDLSALRSSRRQDVADRLEHRQARRPIDTVAEGPWRSTLLRLEPQHHRLLLSLHRLVADRRTLELLATDLAESYDRLVAHNAPQPRPMQQYADFARRQRHRLESGKLQSSLLYWAQRLEDAPALLELPTDRPRPTLQNFRVARQPLVLAARSSAVWNELCQQPRSLVETTLLTAFEILLHRYSGKKDLVVAVPADLRRGPDTERLLGPVSNTLVLRTNLEGDPELRNLCQQSGKELADARANQDVPFETLVEILQPERDRSRNPLAQVLFSFRSPAPPPWSAGGVSLQIEPPFSTATELDLSLALTATDDGIRGTMEYDPRLFDATTITRMRHHYRSLLRQIIATPRRRLSRIDGLSEAERHQLLCEWTDTRQLREPALLQQFFEAQSERTPEAVAILCRDQSCTYGELEARANRLARLLRCRGLRSEQRVAIFLDRSPDLIIAIVAILKAGGAYLPLDPKYPSQRLVFMLRDARAVGVLTTSSGIETLPDPGDAWVVCLDRDTETMTAQTGTRPTLAASADQLAYLIYTSGSTGRAKGVAISHRSAGALIEWALEVYSGAELARVVAATSVCFDLSIFEIFVPLASGGQVLLIDDALALAEIRHRDPTLVNTVPGAIDEALRAGAVPSSVRTVNLAGEALARDLANRVFEHSSCERLFNLYGPSEDTTYSTWARIEANNAGPPPIGRPITQTRALVLDRQGQPVPIGVIGELTLGGDGLARCYLERPALTAAGFLPDPRAAPGQRFYRTGDLVRSRPDGQLDFLGRIDHQVKLRGYRIELGEIEATLRAHPAIREAVVLVQDELLVAYLTTDEPVPAVDSLRTFMAKTLPEFMLPQVFEHLDALPRMPNGKVDRSALARTAPRHYSANKASALGTAPKGAVEEVLTGIWCRVLGVEQIAAYDHFFNLGGHSLMANRVLSRVREAFGVELPVSALFTAPTLRAFSRTLEKARLESFGAVDRPLVPTPRETFPPLSFAQQQIWLFHQVHGNLAVYNVAEGLRLEGPLRPAVLERALDEIVRRHEVLRTRLLESPQGPYQAVQGHRTYRLPKVDLAGLSPTDQRRTRHQLSQRDARRSIDPRTDSVYVFTLLRLATDSHELLVTLHHVATDGWSMDVFYRELSTIYQSFAAGQASPWAELPVQYIDFTVWHRTWLNDEILTNQLAYWRRQLAGLPAALELPSDRPRPATAKFRGHRLPVKFEATLADALRELGQQRGLTLMMTLMAGLQVLLSRLATQQDLAIGVPSANRGRRETENMLGFFINMLVLRADLSDDPELPVFHRQVRHTALAAYNHQEVPFDRLVEEILPQRDASRPPLFQVLFQLTSPTPPTLPGLDVRWLERANGTAKFDLELSLTETKDGIGGYVEYDRDLFDVTTITRWLRHYQSLLWKIVTFPHRRLSQLGWLSNAERHQLVREWNDTASTETSAALLPHGFELQAKTASDTIAIVCGQHVCTYGELDARANRLAHCLCAHGLATEQRVAIFLDRSIDMVVAILATLKAGGAYLPLDPEYPPQRLAFMLQDARAVGVLTTTTHLDTLPDAGRAWIICLDRDAAEIGAAASSQVPTFATADHLAYLIYTSGSTGRAKGVAISHRNANALIRWSLEVFTRAELARVVAATSICFDLSIFEIFGPLASGGQVLLIDNALGLSKIQHLQPTLLNTVPGALDEVLRARSVPTSAKTINLAGEALQRDLANRVFEQSAAERLLNLYGPSEDTTYSTFARIETGESGPPIGRPITCTQAIVLDRAGRLVPLGVTGELYLGGAGLARCYLDRPALTAERFLPDPRDPAPGRRLYRTGDLVRTRGDGQLEFLGRLDHQVKLRGYRIELGEIEAAVRAHPAVHEVVVLAQDARLAAFLTADEPAPTVNELRSFTRQTLPEVMVPSSFALLSALPRTPNGKTDRSALLRHRDESTGTDGEVTQEHDDGTAPRGTVEDVLARLWARVLNVDRVAADAHFFDLGGHSLTATRLLTRVREAFDVELPVGALFKTPILRDFAHRLEAAHRESAGGESTRGELPPLKAEPRHGPLPLSFAQQGIWLLEQAYPDLGVHLISAPYRITGPIDLQALDHGLQEIVRRHEVLRSRVTRGDDGLPQQQFRAAAMVALPVVDLTALAKKSRAAELERLAFEDAARSFDLDRDVLLRTALLRLATDEHVLLLTMHHLVSDGWSIGILTRELGALYAAFTAGRASPLPELPLQVADVTLWQRRWLRDEMLASQLAFWRRGLEGAPGVLELPCDRPRRGQRTFRGRRLPFELAADVSASLRRLGRDRSATLYMTLLAGFETLLHLSTGQPDLVVGTAYTHRARREVEDLIGFFVNTLALRTLVDSALDFGQLLDRVRQVALAAHAHQDVPFDRVVAALAPERDPSRPPIFQVFFHLLNVSTALKLPELTTQALERDNGSVEFDLELTVIEDGPTLRGFFEYNRDLFDATTVLRLLARFTRILFLAAATPELSLARCGALAAAERQQLLVEWNDTQSEPGGNLGVHQLVAKRAREQPDAIAVGEGSARLSYWQLDIRANRLAHELILRGVGRGQKVALLLERSTEAIVSVLAVLKAGAAYLPLDPTHPQQRLVALLADADVACLVTREALLSAVGAELPKSIRLDSDAASISQRPSFAPSREVIATDLAYVIYTSGSTGQPKGVSITHGSLAHYTHNALEAYAIEADDRILQFASLTFDASVEEIYPALSSSAMLVLRTPQMLSSPAGFLAQCNNFGITVLDLPTAFWHQLAFALAAGEAELPPTIRLVIIGGEKAQSESLLAWQGVAASADVQLLNTYGPTETTVVVSRAELAAEPAEQHPETAPPIGRPIADTGLYVLDDQFRPNVIGIPGRLLVGGQGLARGYLDRPALTAERFVPHPFSNRRGARLYSTGDRVRLLADGAIEYLGRSDHQQKIRGFRVEPGEIESALETHPAVQRAIVVARDDVTAGHRSLVAWVVPKSRPVAANELRTFLNERLPHYSIPAAFADLESIPMTTAGKVDRAALERRSVPTSEPDVDPSAASSKLLRTPLEEMLADIWCEVLGRQRLSVEDNFFALGGHSLLATQILSRIETVLGHNLPLHILFTNPTLGGLAAALDEASFKGSPQLPPLVSAARDSPTPLSFGQQRLWFLSRAFSHPEVYQIPEAWQLTGDLAPAALERALWEIVRRHQVLRSRLVDGEDGPYQVIEPTAAVALPRVDLSAIAAPARHKEVHRLSLEDAQATLDLAAGQPLRATLLQLEPREHILFVTMHHAVSDGWSVDVLAHELATLYRSLVAGKPSPLPDLPIQYADFAAWQRRWLTGETLSSLLEFWKRTLSGAPAALELPTDRPRPAELTYRGSSLQLPMLAKHREAVAECCRQHRVTAFMIELAAFQLLLSRYTGSRDVVVGSPIANRDRQEIEGSIGFFVNTLPLRLDLAGLQTDGQPTVDDLLRRTRESMLEAYAHRQLPFEKLVEELQPRRDTSRTPIFQVFFQHLATAKAPPDFGSLSCRPWVRDRQLASFELSLSMVELEGNFVKLIEFNRDLYDTTSIARLANQYAVLLSDLTADPARPLVELARMEAAERQQLLVEWNDTQRDDTPIEHCHELIAEQAKRAFDAVAVVAGTCCLSYRELDTRATALAHHLLALGAQGERPIGIFMERSLEMVVGLLGILKAGAPYLPLDPSFPDQRLAFMLRDAFRQVDTPVVVTSSALRERLAEITEPRTRWVDLPLADLPLTAASTAQKPPEIQHHGRHRANDATAYIIYTSGSTGKPKGVQIPHQAVSNFLHTMAERPGLQPHDTMLAVTTLAFDISVLEIFLPLSLGARLVVAERDDTTDGQQLRRLMASSAATVMQATPATWRLLLETGWRGTTQLTSLCGGEALPAELATRLASSCAGLWNLYGPTETTVWSAVRRLRPDDAVTLGRPIANTRIDLLDPDLAPVPIGVPGEVFIGERGLSRGYLHRAGLTADRFLPDPLAASRDGVAGGRLYRVGDLARRLADGTLEFLGRVDFQVKVRGYRIELGEIETVLARHPALRQVTVVVREDALGESRLVAYLVAATSETPGPGTLREYLRQTLPDYMVPSVFVELDALPLTPNGKIDRKALPAPDQPMQAGEDFVAPTSITETELAKLWQELLGVDRVGRFDNFFELGGHSFLAVHLMTHIRNRLGVEVPIAALFRTPTIEQLAALIDSKSEQLTSALMLLGGQPTAGRPVFCIHGLGGHLFRLEPLARAMPGTRPFYGVQGWKDPDDLRHLESVGSMADAYLAEIVQLQPQGPYFLAGYSMGCMVAFEIARRLEEAGQLVAFIGLLDTPADVETDPSQLQRVSFEAALAQELRIPISMPRLAELVPEKRLGYVVAQGLESGTLPTGFTEADATAYIESFKMTFVAFVRYRIPVCPLKVTLFATEEDADGDDLTQGWGAFATRGVEVIPVPGDHVTMMRQPHVEALAERFAAAVDRAEAEAEASTLPRT